MKAEISKLFGEEYARLAVILNNARGWAKGTLPTYNDRKDFFEGIVNGDPDPVDLLREGRDADVVALVEAAKSGTRRFTGELPAQAAGSAKNAIAAKCAAAVVITKRWKISW